MSILQYLRPSKTSAPSRLPHSNPELFLLLGGEHSQHGRLTPDNAGILARSMAEMAEMDLPILPGVILTHQCLRDIWETKTLPDALVKSLPDILEYLDKTMLAQYAQEAPLDEEDTIAAWPRRYRLRLSVKQPLPLTITDIIDVPADTLTTSETFCQLILSMLDDWGTYDESGGLRYRYQADTGTDTRTPIGLILQPDFLSLSSQDVTDAHSDIDQQTPLHNHDMWQGFVHSRHPATGSAKPIFISGITGEPEDDTPDWLRQKILLLLKKLEHHYRDAISVYMMAYRGRLWIDHYRRLRRSTSAMIKISVDLAQSNMISKSEAINRTHPRALAQAMTYHFDAAKTTTSDSMSAHLSAPQHELGASSEQYSTLHFGQDFGSRIYPGAASGVAIFSPTVAVDLALEGYDIILFLPLNNEVTLLERRAIQAAKAVIFYADTLPSLLGFGQETKHIGLRVARALRRPTVIMMTPTPTAPSKETDAEKENNRITETDTIYQFQQLRKLDLCGYGTPNDTEMMVLSLEARDTVTLDSVEGILAHGIMTVPTANPMDELRMLMGWIDHRRRMKVYSHTPQQTESLRPHYHLPLFQPLSVLHQQAQRSGADGVGLIALDPLFQMGELPTIMREMALATGREGRKQLVKPLVKELGEHINLFMDTPYEERLMLTFPELGFEHYFPATEDREGWQNLAEQSGQMSAKIMHHRAQRWLSDNHLLGIRGCRMGMVAPQLYSGTAYAVMQSLLHSAYPSTMPVHMVMPYIASMHEMSLLREIIRDSAYQVAQEHKGGVPPYRVGAMIEIPRALIRMTEIADYCDFLVINLDRLTELSFGLSRESAATFFPDYLRRRIFNADPFQSLDSAGIGTMLKQALSRLRRRHPRLPIGLMGQAISHHDTVALAESWDVDMLFASPHDVPIARLAAAQARLSYNN